MKIVGIDSFNKLVKCIMTLKSQQGILGLVSQRWENITRAVRANPYIELLLCTNKVHCYRCREHIKIGENYYANGRATSPKLFRKYYHSNCYESLFL